MRDRTRHRGLAGALAALAVAAPACGGGDDSGDSVVFFGYEDSFNPEVLSAFADSYPDSDLETVAFSDESEAETKLRAGFEADVVELCAGEYDNIVESGLLAPLDTERIDAWDEIFPSFQGSAGSTDADGNVYYLPLQGGSSGIVYNAEAVPGGITSYADLFSPDFEGDIAISQSAVSSIGDAAVALGYADGLWSLTPEQVGEAVDLLVSNPNIRTTFEGDADLVQLLATGEVVAAAHGFPALEAVLEAEGIDIEYVAPADGEIAWNCGLGISADAANVDGAYEVLNHWLSVPTQMLFAEQESYLASNSLVVTEGDPAIVAEFGLDSPGTNTDSAILEGTPDNLEVWEDEWRRFQTR